MPGVVEATFLDRTVFGPRPTWSIGDGLRITFGSPVNVKPGWPTQGGSDFVDALFQFSHSLGTDYSGFWRDASVFVVVVLVTAPTAPPLNSSATLAMPAASVMVLGSVRAEAGSGPSAALDRIKCPLTGNYGNDEAPQPLSVTARDPDNSGLGFGPGDVLAVAFSLPTNKDTGTNAKMYVDSLFSFDPPVGEEYSGEWTDDSTFVITIQRVGDSAPALGRAQATVTGAIFDIDRARPSAVGQSAVLSGNYGLATPPRLVSFVADDPTDLDSVYGEKVWPTAFGVPPCG